MSTISIPVQAMTARRFARISARAVWSRRFALFAAQVILLAVALHRVGWIATPVAVNLLMVSIVAALVALLLAAAGAVEIWRTGVDGMGRIVAAAAIALLVLAGPALYVPELMIRPQINDVATNVDDAPKFHVLALERKVRGATLEYPRNRVAGRQLEAYPDVRPMALERSADQTFELVREAVERLNWHVVSVVKPSGNEPGRIEAVARTMIMGFPDDVAIRVAPSGRETMIDVRSASRYGEHDFGANAKRIVSLFDEIRFGLEKGEKEALELALARRAAAEREKARKAKAERERLKAEEEKRLSRLREELYSRQQAPAEQETQGAQEQTRRQRLPGWDADPHIFWRRFGE